MRRVIGISGVPGTGKTTLVREILTWGEFEFVEPKKMLPCLYCKKLDLYILGKYAEGEVFAGTDKLSMAVQPVAEEFLKETTSNVLFEGDRLTTAKFFDYILDLPETDARFIVLSLDKETLDKRYVERGSNQSETFLKGRDTKIAGIMSNFGYIDNRVSFKNRNLEDQKIILSYIKDFLEN